MIDLLVLQIWIVSIPANKDRYVMDGNIQIVPSAWEGTGNIGSVYVRFYFSWGTIWFHTQSEIDPELNSWAVTAIQASCSGKTKILCPA